MFPFSRSRIHPLLLVPVFLFGVAFSRFNPPALPNPVYHGDVYTGEDPYQPFLPPDAPPLNQFEEEDLRRASDRNGDGRPRSGRGTGGDNGEWDSEVDPDDATSRPAHLRQLEGYLYFPPAAPLVSMHIPLSTDAYKAKGQFDQLLVISPQIPEPVGRNGQPLPGPPPPPVLEWSHPGAPFRPPVPPSVPVAIADTPAARHPAAAAARVPPVAVIPQARKLGANAEAMRRANLEGRPFKPVKPAEILQDQRLADVAERRKVAIALAEKAELQRQKDQREWTGPIYAPKGQAPLPIGRNPAAPPRRVPAPDHEPTSQEMADEDAELLEIFDSLTTKERELLTVDELAVFMELENEHGSALFRMERAANGGRAGGGELRRNFKRAAIPSEDSSESEESVESSPEVGTDAESKVADVVEEIPTAVEDEDSALHVKRAEESSPRTERVHPMAYLIQEAEEKWDALLERQSQTLFQAVVEYQRRYGRKPPLGFDAWWRYAMQNRVVLVDEYDQIDEDIKPFFSLPASEIRARQKALASNTRLPHHAETFTVDVEDGAISVYGPFRRGQLAEDAQNLMGQFAESLPDISLTFASHELPTVAISGEARLRHEHYATNGHVLDQTQRRDFLENTAYQPWQGLCRPNSTSRRVANGQSTGRPHGPSFVSTDHLTAMDMCLHPELLAQNGFTSWDGPRPYLLYPLFSWSKTSMHADILSAPVGSLLDAAGRVYSWEKKTQSKVMWRGDTTGMYARRGSTWRTTQRSRLVLLTSDHEGQREVHFADPKAHDAIRRFTGPTADINAFYFDVGFSGTPIQCDPNDQTCQIMLQELRFLPTMNKDRANLYKYVLDVDGNGASSDLSRLLHTGTVVFKSTIFPQCYVPIKSDYSDLTDAAAFFIGAPDGTASHDALGKKIAENGKKWAKDHMREADMAAYQFRLYLEYARLVSRVEEGSHDFVLDN
ncbi:hypothetical protein RQP46_006511 [Phenoliferia psychrophenolica]